MSKEKASQFWQQRFNAALERGLAELNEGLAVIPDSIHLLSINLVCLLDYIRFRHPHIVWQQWDRLQYIHSLMITETAFSKTLPKG